MIANGKRLARVLLVLVFLMATLLYYLPSQGVYAAQITNRSLTLQAGATDGGSKPSGVVNHLFSFSIPSTASIGSILFQYCTTAANSVASPTCVTPHGLSTTSATMGSQSGATGFTLVNTTNGAPYLTRTAASITGPQAVSYQLLGVTNPDGNDCFGGTPPASLNCTFFVRISTYASTDTSGPATDTGTVAASIAQQIVVTGIMPESLIFCTGGQIFTTSSIPDCSTATSGAISFNQLFSPTSTSTTTSQMAASTNAQFGFVITVNGTTLTSGSNTINPMNPAALAVHGSNQFGINLRANTTTTSTPAVGADVTPAANGSNYKGEALAGYNSVDNFKFNSTDPVADSGNGGAGPTDAQIFTVSYIVNVPGSQPAGTYTTTLTYICTPTF